MFDFLKEPRVPEITIQLADTEELLRSAAWSSHSSKRTSSIRQVFLSKPIVGLFSILAGLLSLSLLFRFVQSSQGAPEVISTTLPLTTIASVSHYNVVTPEDLDVSPYRVYKSSPITPPILNVTRYEGDLADGLLFLTPRSREKRMGTMKAPAPYIFAMDGDLVYAHNRTNLTLNMRMQEYGGAPHLTFWQGPNVGGYGYGRMFTLDQEYHQDVVFLNETLEYEFAIDRVVPGFMDFHEQEVTERGTVLVTAYGNAQRNVSQYPAGTVDDIVLNSYFFEIDLQTGKTLFSWSALDHISPHDSHTPVPEYVINESHFEPWDFFHINSVQDLEDGYLVSSRHLWSIFLVSKIDGHVIWKLDGSGGAEGSFGRLPREAQFQWQHHARAHNVTKDRMELSIFDNHCTMHLKDEAVFTRGLLLEIDLPPDLTQPPKLLKQVGGVEPWFVDSQGSYEAHLSNGNQLMGYGTVPVVEEFGPLGDLRWRARFGRDFKVMSYRAFKDEWHAIPHWEPSLVLEEEAGDDEKSGKGSVTAYVSWNGATDVEFWGVYLGDRKGKMTSVGKVAKEGFETSCELIMGGNECVQFSAWQASKEIRFSNTVCLGDEPIVFVAPYDEEYDVPPP